MAQFIVLKCMTSYSQSMKNTKIISLTWENLSAQAKGKTVLSNCSGYCRPGEMLAIMGPSGAGKTTLLSLLCKRQSASLTVEGEVLASGESFDSRQFYKFGSFVYQNDLLFERLTVRETLEFAALLKIPSRQAALEKTEQLIEDFELQKCADGFVGGPTLKGISGGEKKRVCVAIEMVSEPALIMLDQPTSGLDSNKAARLLSILKKLASNGRTVIFTIHQPSYLQYAKLDRLLLLDRGETIYQGPAAQVAAYMSSLGILVSQSSTVSDFFMMEISQYKRDKSSYETPFNVANYGRRLAQQNCQQMRLIKEQPVGLDTFDGIYEASFWFSFRLIFKRDCVNIVRSSWKLGVLLLQVVMKILLLGVFFLNEMPSVERVATSYLPNLEFFHAQSACFNTIAGNIIPAIISVALTIPAERALYYKQADSKKYKPLPYFLTKVITEMLLVTAGTIVFAIAAYWLVGFTRSGGYFANYLMIVVAASFVGNGLGFFCSTLFREIDRVAPLTDIVMIPLLVLSGIFNLLGTMPEWSSWMQYVSPFRYGTHLLMENQYGDETFGGLYDYKTDLGVNMSYEQNMVALVGLGLCFYLASFFLLKYFTVRIAP